ncbi:DUF3237 domain-containing protein [Nocardia sp. NPDC003345]
MTTETRSGTAETIRTEHLFDMTVDLETPLNFGGGPIGRRVLYRATGGSFQGPRLSGEVVPGGGDWALYRPDGTMLLDVRLTLRADNDLVHMTYQGRWVIPPEVQGAITGRADLYAVDPARYYFRTAILFETGSERHSWLNDIVAVGSGRPIDGGVAYHVERVL